MSFKTLHIYRMQVELGTTTTTKNLMLAFSIIYSQKWSSNIGWKVYVKANMPAIFAWKSKVATRKLQKKESPNKNNKSVLYMFRFSGFIKINLFLLGWYKHLTSHSNFIFSLWISFFFLKKKRKIVQCFYCKKERNQSHLLLDWCFPLPNSSYIKKQDQFPLF